MLRAFCEAVPCPRWSIACLALAACFSYAPLARAQFQMPDAKQMSGIPRPVTDLPNGSVSVRLIKGDLSNNITNHVVELHVGSKVLRVKTDEMGRAEFDKLEAGATVKAVADVDGEHLESQEFPAPVQGGVRLMLVATDTSKGPATEPNAPAVQGQVVLGSQSRIIMEPGDEVVHVFYLLDIANTARTPVNTANPFTFDLPAGAIGASLLEGSSPLASVSGPQVRVKQPFPPGNTAVQVAFDLPAPAASLDVTQRFPAALEGVALVVKKVGETKLTSRQIARQQDMTAQGEVFIAATGDAVAAGQPLSISLADLPHHNPAPRRTALLLASAVIVIGIWTTRRTPEDATARAAERKRLVARREKVFADLVRVEHDRRNGRIDDRRYSIRRDELVAALEQIYGALDEDDIGPDPADRAGVAA